MLLLILQICFEFDLEKAGMLLHQFHEFNGKLVNHQLLS